MGVEFWNTLLSRFAAGTTVPPELDALCRSLAVALRDRPPAEAAGALPAIYLRIANHLRGLQALEATRPADGVPVPTPIPPTPEIIEWALGLFSEEEAVAGLREIRETGGLTFEQLVEGLEPAPAHG